MDKKQTTEPTDDQLLEMAYSTTYKSTVRALIRQAKDPKTKALLAEHLKNCHE